MNTDDPELALSRTEDRVLEIQTKLHRRARDDPRRRFDDLFNLMTDPAFLLVAWDRVRSNKGAKTAGVDGATALSIVHEEIYRYVASRLSVDHADDVAAETFLVAFRVRTAFDHSEVLAGMQWAVEQGADVVNMSLGAPDVPGPDLLEEAVELLTGGVGDRRGRCGSSRPGVVHGRLRIHRSTRSATSCHPVSTIM